MTREERTRKMVKELFRLNEEKKRLEAEIKTLKAKLEERITDKYEVKEKDYIIRCLKVIQNREDVDKKALRQNFPDVFQKVKREYQVEFLKIQAVKG